MKYKGYTTTIKYSIQDKVFYGVLENISDLVSFEGNTKNEAEKNFHDAVDDYIEMCKEIEKF